MHKNQIVLKTSTATNNENVIIAGDLYGIIIDTIGTNE